MSERLINADVLDAFDGHRFEPAVEPHRGVPVPLRYQNELDVGRTVVPQWNRGPIPRRELPIYHTEPTIDLDSTVLYPDQTADIVWFTPTRLDLFDFSLTVRREQRPDGSVAVTGGSAILSVSAYSGAGFERTVADSGRWTRLVANPRGATAAWAAWPAPQYGLGLSLELPPGVAAAPPLITESPLAGSATIAVELTESGVLTWRAALEANAGATVPGVVRASTTAPWLDVTSTSLEAATHTLDTPLGTLLAGRGAADIVQIDPQQTVRAQLVVIGSQLVTGTTVALRPGEGQAPSSAVFGPTGGRAGVAITTQHPNDVGVDWTSEVAFTPMGWPLVRASGRLDAENGWISMMKPESWCVGYLLVVVPVDAAGKAVPAASLPGDRAQGVLNFTAPYVSEVLSTAFEAEYARPVSVALPRYPDEPFGDLVLTVFTTRQGKSGQASRRLGANDVTVVVTVHPDGHVVLHTGNDAVPESSAAANILSMLAEMTTE